jgi:hypothetical protein
MKNYKDETKWSHGLFVARSEADHPLRSQVTPEQICD